MEIERSQELSADVPEKMLVWNNAQMAQIMRIATHISPSKATVLIQGESGTGKDLLAHFIHNNSARSKRPLIYINTSSMNEADLDKELFGIDKANTLGLVPKTGKFEAAHQATIIIDEIANLSLNLQGKLFQLIQEGVIEKVGGKSPVAVNPRIVATTCKDLKELVRKGEFRKDLYYRLNVIKLNVPALRDRKDDIAKLAEHFMERVSSQDGRSVKRLSHDALDKLTNYSWPGNVRELENVVERAFLTSEGSEISANDIMIDSSMEQMTKADVSMFVVEDNVPLHEIEKRYIIRTLQNHSGNRTHAARALGISIRTLRNKINEYRKENIIL